MLKKLAMMALGTAIILTPIHSFAGQTGGASYYGTKFVGKKTASGERYTHGNLTAAHRTHRFGTRLKVTNLRNGKSVVVKVNDRGPFVRGRIVDLSLSAAKQIGMVKSGVAKVKIEVISGSKRNKK